MSTWFVRSNGDTAHNEPGTNLFMPGEPPAFPARRFNYREECIAKAFVRVGWPAAGDLREGTWRSRAATGYGSTMKRHHVRFLELFVQILPGYLVLLPAGDANGTRFISAWSFHRARLNWAARPRQLLLPLRHSTSRLYDHAHRVDVIWAIRPRRHAEYPRCAGDRWNVASRLRTGPGGSATGESTGRQSQLVGEIGFGSYEIQSSAQ